MGITQKAGAVILNSKEDSILLLFRGPLKDWTFPKGHIEDGENELDAMIREVKEETGLDVDVIRKLPNLEYLISQTGENCVISFYLVKAKNDFDLKLEHQEDALEWVKIDEVCDKLSYADLKEYFNNIKEIIKKL